ncbi:anti-phage protein KwaA, partial [Vibrio parahaemolyticus]
RFEYELKGGSQDSLRVEQSKSESYEHLTFLATYIIPFLGFSFDEPRKLAAYVLLLVVIGFIFVRTDKYYANPTLALLG